MNQLVRPTLKDPKILLVTFFGVGFFPIAPGTAGALAAVPILILTSIFQVPLLIYITSLIALTILSCIVADKVQRHYNVHDPSWIVIDEVIGIATSWVFISSLSWYHILLIFLLFRLFDITKIWPACFFDRKITHGIGTIADDAISGIYAGILYTLINKAIALLA